MIRMNVDENTLKTGVGLEKIVQQIFWYQIFWKDSIGKDIYLMKKQKDMYNAKDNVEIKSRKNRRIDGMVSLLNAYTIFVRYKDEYLNLAG